MTWGYDSQAVKESVVPIKIITSVPTVFALGLACAACQSPSVPPTRAPGPEAAAVSTSPSAVKSFQDWLGAFRSEASQKGISGKTLESALTGVHPIPRVIELDRRQPEFTQTFWRYLDSTVSDARVRDGIERAQQNQAILAQLEKTYGVPERYLVAFWGLETNYGRNLGGFPVVSALATLAFDGRRNTFFRTELIDALKVIDAGHITPDKMVGSWAGAMGQTQFMPSTFLRHAVDQTGDGRIDIWAQTADALGSGANYLKSLGWDSARTWGREVKLPPAFDAALASLDGGASETLKTLDEWAALGITAIDGARLPRQPIRAALILPAGQKGPAFLVYDNFRAILKWNRSTFYALAIGHLADRINGQGKIQGARIDEEPLSRDQVLVIQTGLKRMGFLDSEPDGVLGSGTRQALRKFQKAQQLPPDGYANRAMLAAIVNDRAFPAPITSNPSPVAFAESSR